MPPTQTFLGLRQAFLEEDCVTGKRTGSKIFWVHESSGNWGGFRSPTQLPDTLTKQSIDSPLVIACVAGGLFCERKKGENGEGFFARSEKRKK